MLETELLTVGEVAQELRTSKLTIYRAISGGRLAALRIGERGPLRIERRELRNLLQPTNPNEREDE